IEVVRQPEPAGVAVARAQDVLDLLQDAEGEDAPQATAVEGEDALGPAVVREVLIAVADHVRHGTQSSSPASMTLTSTSPASRASGTIGAAPPAPSPWGLPSHRARSVIRAAPAARAIWSTHRLARSHAFTGESCSQPGSPG